MATGSKGGPMTAGRAAAYGAALAMGALFVALLFPGRMLLPPDYPGVAQFGDRAQAIIGQRYFLAAPWGWPPLEAPVLDTVNVALTDSIPLALLLLKPWRAWLPPGFFLQEGWIALCWALQPAAAVYALRGAGVTTWPGTLAVGALSLLPTLLARFGHASLCAHALILVAIGFYLRQVQPRQIRADAGQSGWAGWPAVPLLLIGLLVHPYLMVMTAAVLAAGPLSLLLAGRRWGPAASWLAAGLACTGGVATVLGLGGLNVAAGYGVFSMNLLAPLLPSRSTLFPELAFDATGGQIGEGYQYLGAGVLGLLAVAGALVAAGRAKVGWRRHRGMALVMAGLALFAASGDGYVGPHRLWHVEWVPEIVQQFRVTGRFFWPVGYALLVAAVAIVARGLPSRWATLVLLGAVGLQAADMPKHWSNVRVWLDPQSWVIDAAGLAPVIARHDRLTLWPTFACGVDGGTTAFMQVLLVASRTAPPVNTMYTARWAPDPDCDAEAVLGRAWEPNELRVILPPATQDRSHVADGDRLCRRLDLLVLCSNNDPADPAPTP